MAWTGDDADEIPTQSTAVESADDEAPAMWPLAVALLFIAYGLPVAIVMWRWSLG